MFSPAVFSLAPFLALASLPVLAQDTPAAPVWPITISSDGRFGVTVLPSALIEKPDGTYDDVSNPQNAIVEVKTGRVLGFIKGDVAFQHMNSDEIVPACWSADDSRLLWQVDGKWGFSKIFLIDLKDGAISRQVDLLTLLQGEILKRTQKARPQDYAAVKAASTGDGSWFRDGFAIDCVLDAQADRLTFPIRARVFLSSNPKDIEGKLHLDARMTAYVEKDGTIQVEEFHLGDNPPARDFIRDSMLPGPQ